MATTESGRRTKIRARDVFEAYFMKHHREDLTEILEAREDVELHYPVFVNFLTMFEEHTEVAESLLTSPTKLLPVMDLALFRATTKLLDDFKEKGCDAAVSLKTNLHARITGLPSCPELYRDRVPRTADVGRLLCVTGTVVRRTTAKMLEYQKEFMCTKCRHVFTVVADHDQYYQLNKPSRCPSPEECHSFNFNVLSSASKPIHTKDYQELKIQEQVQKLKMGSIPGSMWVTLEDDLVDSCRPGDDVVICAVVRRRWRSMTRDVRPSVDLVLRANNVMVDNKDRGGSTTLTEEMREEFTEFWDHHCHDPMTARNIILASFCPQVYGLYVVKLAVAVVVAGGVQKTINNTRIRGEAHLLLVGDPGTAKSQFLKYTSALVPRSVFTTGASTTSAGLTVTVVREEGEWALEAGALVMADGGVCCIDEFSSVKEADRVAIHEAMEQQTISVAKAGLLCKLDSRCSVLAATNPKEEGNPEDTVEFIGLGSPLLSRFDLVLVLKDAKNLEWDRVVSEYILNGQDPGEVEGTGAEEDWSLEKLRAYLCLVRSLQPQMTPEANEVLSRYYQVQRQNDLRSKARTTLRLLESLVRLSQGHARLLMRETVGVQDAVVAISLLEASMGGFSAVMDINPLYTAFPQDARQEYRTQVQVILENLSLPHILKEEMTRLDEEDENLASSRKLFGTCKKRGPSSTFVTSTQKLPSTVAFQSRKDFRPSVNEESFALDIEELHETTSHRKRPRGGAQQTMNKWVEPDTLLEVESSVPRDDISDDDLEIIRPKQQKKRKEKEKGKSGETQVKNVKRKKIKKSIPKEDILSNVADVMPSTSLPCSVSHVERAGEELLQDLDDFAEDTWTPTKARNELISSLAKFAYKKPGKESNPKSSWDQEASVNKVENNNASKSLTMSNSDTKEKKKTCNGNSPKTINKNKEHFRSIATHSPLKERPVEGSNSTRVISDLEDVAEANREEKIQESELRKSPLEARKDQKLHRTFTPCRESSFAKLKQFAYSPPEDEIISLSPQNTSSRRSCHINKRQKDRASGLVCSDGKDMKDQTSNMQIHIDSTTAKVNVSNERQGSRSKEDILSLTHARIKEAKDKRLFLSNNIKNKKVVKSPVKMQHSQEDRLSLPSQMRGVKSYSSLNDTQLKGTTKNTNQTSEDVRNKENGRGTAVYSPGSSESTGNERKIDQPTSNLKRRESSRETDQPPSDSNSRKAENKKDENFLERYIDLPDAQKQLDKANVKLNRHTDSPSPTTGSILNTPPPSSSSSKSSYFSTSGSKSSKLKRSCFTLDEGDEDMDIFDSPTIQTKANERESKRQDVSCSDVSNTPVTTTTSMATRQPSQAPVLKNPLFTPSPVTGRLKLPVVYEGVDKYKALASDELDDFDFDL